MIDTHCHLLPGLDDGPATIDDALRLAHDLVDQGVGTVVCTSHWSRQFPTTHEGVRDAHELVRAALEQHAIPLRTIPSAELSDVVGASAPIDEVRRRSIGGHSVVVEVLRDSLPLQTRGIVARLSAAGLTVVLAHPERCRAVQDDPDVLDPLRGAGALVQLVAPSITGRSGEKPEATAWTILATGRADLVASDTHDQASRPCELASAGELVRRHLGEELWRELTTDAPQRLLDRTAEPDREA